MSMKRLLERLKPGHSEKPPEAKAGQSTQKPVNPAQSDSGAPGSALAKPPQAQKDAPSPAKAKAAESTASDAAPPYRRARPPVPAVITEEYLANTFGGLGGLLEDKEVKENTKDGLRLVESLLTDPFIFKRWLGDNRMLALFLKAFPDMHQRCVNNIFDLFLKSVPQPQRWTEGWHAFFGGRICLFGFLDNCPRQRRQIMDFVFAHREIYAAFISRPVIGEFLEKMEQIDREEKLEGEASYQHKVMMILATDVALYNECIMNSRDFWDWQADKKTEAYREAFFKHHIKDDKAHNHLFPYQLEALLEKFPHKKAEILDSILSTPKRFKHTFSALSAIHYFTPDYQTNEEQRQLRQRLFEYALTIPGYIKEDISIVTDLFALYDAAPDFGQYVMDKMIEDPEWLLKALRMQKDLKAVCEQERYKPLKEAYIANIYLYPDKFTSHITDESDLNEYITILPEEEANLRHHYDLFTQKATTYSKM